jgi:hypothetical protein
MPSTITKIASYTFTSDAATTTFSSIPQTYNHLMVTMSCRIGSGDWYGNAAFRPNGSTALNYNVLRSSGNGSGGSYSDWRTGDNFMYLPEFSGSTATAGAFSNVRVIIQNYTLSRFKSGWSEGGSENNTVGSVYGGPRAFVWRDNAAITSLEFIGISLFLTNSEITLYGIKTT